MNSQKKTMFNIGKLVNLYIVYEMTFQLYDLGPEFTIGNEILRAVKLAKNADVDKYGSSGYVVLDLMHIHPFH